jgi:hypothetical protein
VPGATVEKYIAQQGWIGCVQEKGWFDGPVAQIRVKKVLKPHVQNANQALLLLDHFSVHLTSEFVQSINDLGVNIEYIPAGYTCVLQPVDVGVNAPFKKAIRNLHHSWCMKKYPVVPNGDKLPMPERDDVYGWVVEAFEKVSSESIVKTFKYIGFVAADIDDDNKTETDILLSIQVMMMMIVLFTFQKIILRKRGFSLIQRDYRMKLKWTMNFKMPLEIWNSWKGICRISFPLF